MFSNYSDFLDYFYSLRRSGIKLGLEHTTELLKAIGNPHKKLEMIHIAGTNGKGSCSSLIDSILRESGKKVGLYTSPHLIDFNERIRINGKSISNSEIISFIKKNHIYIEKIKSTFFEVSTVMALDYFFKNKVEVAVIETGLGGRLDSTNVIKPKLSIITQISLDHLDILGNTIIKIAEEKSGIIKHNTPLVISKQLSEVKELLLNKSLNKSAPLIEISEILDVIISSNGTTFKYKNKNYRTSLIGVHQASNASIAIESVNIYDKDISNDIICKGLENVYWPGRIQRIDENIFFDVAHNKESIKILMSTMKILFPGKSFFGLFCLKGDKELVLISKELINKFDKLFICNDKNKLLLEKKILSKRLKYYNVNNEIVESIEIGIKKLKYLTLKNGIGLVFGSHYIARDILNCSEISFDRLYT